MLNSLEMLAKIKMGRLLKIPFQVSLGPVPNSLYSPLLRGVAAKQTGCVGKGGTSIPLSSGKGTSCFTTEG